LVAWACGAKVEATAPSVGVVAKAPAAPSSSEPTKRVPVRLGFVTNNPSQFWRLAEAGLRAYEREAHVSIDMRMPQNGTVEDQNRILESLGRQGYDAVAVNVISPAEQLQVLDRLAEQTNLITFDSDAEESKRLLHVGTDEFVAGKVLGERVTQLLPRGGKVAVFVGSFSSRTASRRLAGLVSATRDHGIEIVDKREDNTDRAKARGNVEEVIAAHKDLNLVVGLWNYNGPAIAAALEGSRKHGQILAVVFDEDVKTLAAIERGTIQATVVQKPFEFGYVSAKWLHRLATGKEEARQAIPAGAAIDTGVSVIDAGNIASFEAHMAELLKPVACDALVARVCADLPGGSAVCAMVREETPTFSESRCAEMLSHYDEVLRELKKLER
jgi:ribose transport system substrate-binding protein